MTINKSDTDSLPERLRAAYDVVKEWPERRGDPMEVGADGFLDLLALRNLVPSAATEIERLTAENEQLREALRAARHYVSGTIDHSGHRRTVLEKADAALGRMTTRERSPPAKMPT